MIGPTTTAKKRVCRAIAELVDHVSEPLPAQRLHDLLERAMNRYLGPAIGMGAMERWYTMGESDLEILVEALEERSAIVNDGPYRAKARAA